MASGTYFDIEIDASEVKNEIDFLKTHMTHHQFVNAMYTVFRQTGNHVGTILKQDLPTHYYVTSKEIGAVVQKPIMSVAGEQVGCTIPLRGPKKSIGGGFTAKGSAKGWQSVRKKYTVSAKIVKGSVSKLPQKMDSYGGMPPFRNIPSKLGSVAFTRSGKSRLPIMKVVGIAVPQMPMNRSRADVERDIVEYLQNRLDHRIQALLNNGR